MILQILSRVLLGQCSGYQLIENYQIIVENNEQGKMCCMFCFLSKTLDRIWNKGLLFKLKT
jgi:hypothetical protein